MNLKVIKIIVIIPFCIIYSQQNRTSNFDQQLLKTVVSIEQVINGIEKPIGTGFVITSKNNHLVLVTAKHIVKDTMDRIRNNLYVRLNLKDELSEIYKLNKLVPNISNLKYITNKGWFFSEDSDIACRFLPTPKFPDLKSLSISFFLEKSAVDVGAPIVVLGFPMGMRNAEYYYPIARKGIISRNDSTQFLADAFIFPGNSGGPVFYIPTNKWGLGFKTSLIGSDKLIGVVVGYKPYKDIARSEQTGNIRVIFEENSGLCNIVPIDYLTDILNEQYFNEIDNIF